MKKLLATLLLLISTMVASFAVTEPGDDEYACLTVQNPGTGNASYFTVNISEVTTGSILLPDVYPGWCMDTFNHITRGTIYTAKIVSRQSGLIEDLIDHPENLALVDWVLNQKFVGQPAPFGTYTYGDVQKAIWTLIDDHLSTSGLGDWNSNNVDAILRDATNNGASFMPACGQVYGLILNPVLEGSCDLEPDESQTIAQVMIVEVPVPCLGDFVWNDSNANGIQDPGEPGLKGVTVNLFFDCTTNFLYATTTTDTNGYYGFSRLDPWWNYNVQVVKPTNFTFSPKNQGGNNNQDSDADADGAMACTYLSAGEVDLSWDAGLYEPVTIGDFVWHDLNANGIQDAGEPGIGGVTVNLSGTDGAGHSVTATTTTDGNGAYLFTQAPGTYTVSVVPPTGYTPTTVGQDTPATDSNPNPSAPVQLASGESDLSIDFGFHKPVTIGDFVWHDLNANGIQESGEPGIGGVTVNLSGTDGAGHSITATTTTDGNGAYLFTQAPGTYTVSVVPPTGYTPTTVGQDTPATDSNPSPSATTPLQLAGGQSDLDIDFGFYQSVTIGDFVWHDLNANGIQESGEPGIGGVTVNLSGTDGAGHSVTAATTTDGNGAYLFTQAPGTYTVSVVPPTGYTPTTVGQDTPATDSNPNPSAPLQLAGGESDLSIDFGFHKPVTIGNFVWHDLNANGIQESGEPGIGGVTVNLSGTDGVGNSVTATTTTDGNGAYLFTQAPGTYTVSVVAPAGFTPTAVGQDGTDFDSNPSPSSTTPLQLAGGQSDLSIDFGFYQSVTIGDFVWHDLNANGIQEPGEPGIGGVTVNLSGTDGAGNSITATTTTDSNGAYLFTQAPGTYTVSVVPPAGYTPTAVGQDGTDFDSNPSPSSTTPLQLAGGQSDLSIDFGFYQSVTIGDFVWHDLNANGIQEPGEPGIGGVTVNLSGTDGAGNSITATTTTDSNGAYLFTQAPGTYTVSVVPPADFTPTTLNKGTPATDSNPSPSSTTPLQLAGGQSDLDIDFGFYQSVTIGDFVWHDLNANGIQEPGEPGIGGVTVNLSGTDGTGNPVTASTTTDDDGAYLFTQAPGTYTVSVVAPAGFTPTTVGQDTPATDSNPSPSSTTPLQLAGGQSDLSIDFGFYKQEQPCVASTFSFKGNSALYGTAGNIRTFTTNGVSVKVSAFSRTTGTSGTWAPAYLGLYSGGLGVTDSGEGTGGNNQHVVDNVNRYNFVLFEFSEPVVVSRAFLGYVVDDSDLSIWIGNFTDPFNQHLNLNDSVLNSFNLKEENLTDSAGTRWAAFNASEVSGNAVVIAAWVGDTSPEDKFKINMLDICASSTGRTSLGNYVWNDLNRDGIQNEPASAGINGVTVKLLNCTGKEIASTATSNDANGNPGYYLFSGLPDGCYQVSFGLPDGFAFTAVHASGNEQTDSNADPATGKTASIYLTAEETDLSWDAGVYQNCLASICGLVLRDCNADGSLSGEQGLKGFPVLLKNANNQVVATTTTTNDGQYCFSDLTAGTYTVVVIPLANYTQTEDPDNCLDHKTQVTLKACESRVCAKFGYTGTAAKVYLVKSGPVSAKRGETITYRFAVTNTGNTCLYGGMGVVDPMLGGEIWHKTPVAPGEGYVFEKTYVVKSTDRDSLVNTATAYGHPPGKLAKVTATSTWTVAIAAKAPTPPTCLEAYATNCAVKLRWQGGSGAASYTVRRAYTPNGTYTTIKTGLTVCAFVDTAVTNGNRYYYVVTGVKNSAESEYSNVVCAFPSAGLPCPWKLMDIGAPENNGGGHYDTAKRVYTLIGSGTDIWNTGDEHFFAYQTGSGNCSIVARVTGVQNTHSWAKAGVMIRESLNANAEHVSVFATPENGVAFQYRNCTGGNSGNSNVASPEGSYWIKIERSGSTFTGYYSVNKVKWTSLGSQTISMGSTVYIGLAVTSHNDSATCLATFDNVTVTP